MTARINQVQNFDAPPSEVFELLLDADKFSAMSGGAPAEIDSSEGGAISLFGGMITGRVIEREADQRVVQAWRAGTWDPGVYSIVRFEIEPDGNGSRLSLDHAGFPEDQAEHLAEGWHANYWAPMQAALGQS